MTTKRGEYAPVGRPEMGIPITISDLKSMRFIAKEIFPGGAVPCDDDVAEFVGRAGFSVESVNYLVGCSDFFNRGCPRSHISP